MANISEVIEQLRDTQAALLQSERAAQEHPNRASLDLTIKSLRKRQQGLQSSFYALAEQATLEVCKYRLFSQIKNENPTLRALGSAMVDFQELFTTVFDVTKNGPKKSSRTSAETNALTSFGFAYAFTGSIGFVLTLPSERLLLGETDFDMAMNTIFKMVQAKTPEEIKEWAELLGPAPIKKVYEWATDHVDAGLGADIEWRGQREISASLFAQASEQEQLRQVIAHTGTETVEEITLTGNLVGADVKIQRFHMQFEGGTEISGKMNVLIDSQNMVSLPKRYSARILKTTRINFAKAEDDVEYYLLSLG